MNARLIQLPSELKRGKNGIVASHVEGYHSNAKLHSEKDFNQFTNFLTECIETVEHGDAKEFRCNGSIKATMQQTEDTQMWTNVSDNNSLNLLHHHSDATWSGVYYVASGRSDEQGYSTGVVLVVRISPGGGAGACEPDEEQHVGR